MKLLNFDSFVNENYPWGAKYDPNAPWNQSEPDIEYILDIDEAGEITLIERNHISREPDNEDWEDEKTIIDPLYMDEFIANKLNLNIDEHEDGIEITDIKEPKENKYIIITPFGEFETDWDELMYIANGKK
jgi:hypothetical protein